MKVEPGVALPLSEPQSDLFDTGASQSVKMLFGVGRYIDLGPTASFTYLPSATTDASDGVIWGLGAGVRLKRPHDAKTLGGLSPWLDLDVLYDRTGDLNRIGLSTAVGFALPLDDDRRYWMGPFVRYHQTVQTEHAGYDNRDAKILTIGLSFEIGSGVPRKARPTPVEVPPEVVPVVVAPPPVAGCPDRDADTIPDSIDHCPDAVGPMDTWGCPVYTQVVVQRDMLQLKDKLYFKLDDATLEPVSLPILDEVAKVLTDNPGFRVQVEGHTDSSGGEKHNQSLSERRAQTVLDYLVARGVAADRLISKGFSSSEPLDTNDTSAGRENNRRVEFVVNFAIIGTGSTP